MSKIKFTPDAGDFITPELADHLCTNYHKDQKTRKGIEPIRAFFFGKEKIQELLNHPDAVGMRIYYGLNINGDLTEKKMVLVAVDQYGNDLAPKPGASQMLSKSMSRASTGKYLDGGFPCPKYCSGGGEEEEKQD